METETEIKKIVIGILTSGGDAPGMNAAIRAIVRSIFSMLHDECKVYGIKFGYKGLFTHDFVELSTNDVSGIISEGGSFLHSERCEQFFTSEGIDEAAKICKENFDALFVIGGNGSLAGGYELSKRGVPVFCLPASVDNDQYGTTTIGFSTAVANIKSFVEHVKPTVKSDRIIYLIRVMGRSTGFLTVAGAKITGADFCFVPELSYDEQMQEFESIVKKRREGGKDYNVVLVAEGCHKDKNDFFRMEEAVASLTGIKTRAVDPDRFWRGGYASPEDCTLASDMGVAAVESFMRGEKNVITISNNNVVICKEISFFAGKHKEFNLGELQRFKLLI